MSVEQTTQLIQLILNSVLLTVACALTLGRLGVRQSAIEERLRVANRHYSELLGAGVERTQTPKLAQAKKSRRSLHRHRRLTHYSLLAANYALLFSIISLLVITLRALVDGDWLIMLALGLFVVSAGLLLVGIGLTLLDLHSSRLPLWEEVKGMVQLGQPSQAAKARKRAPANSSSRLLKPSPTRLKLPAKVRVG
jgi:hypothetical protein